MIIKPNDTIYLVTIPAPGHPFVDLYDDPDWEADMIYPTTLQRLHDVFRGGLLRTEHYEEDFIATSYDEALEIVFDYFPELADQPSER